MLYVEEKFSALKIEKICSALKCQFSPAGQSLIQPFLEPFERNLGQRNYIKRLFQPRDQISPT